MFKNKVLDVMFIFLLQKSHVHSCQQYFRNKHNEGQFIAIEIKNQFMNLFDTCSETTMPNQKFILNNLNSYINYPSKTTVGYSLKFTNNRKFFANMIGTLAFKNMLENDMQEIKNDIIKKMKYCDQVIMDENMLKELYDREVDFSKI